MKQLFTVLLLILALTSTGHAAGDCLFQFQHQSTDVENIGANWHVEAFERSYCSGSEYAGWFGQGWGSTYETRLQINPDGTIAMYEMGNTRETIFHPPRFTPEEMTRRLHAILKNERGATENITPLLNKLAHDEKLRLQYYADLTHRVSGNNVSGPTWPVAAGAEFVHQHGCMMGDLTKAPAGYKYIQGQQTYLFNESGQLLSIELPGGRSTTITRAPGKIVLRNQSDETIELKQDQNGHVVGLNTSVNDLYYAYSAGFLERVSTPATEIATYGYSDTGRLSRFREEGEQEHKILYAEDDYGVIGYVDFDKSDGSSLSVIRESVKTTSDDNKIITIRTESRVDAETTSETVCRHTFNEDKFGYSWRSRKECGKEGVTFNITTFDAKGNPETISYGSRETSFVYDDTGRLVKKERPDEIIELQYDQRHKKISKVIKYNPENREETRQESNFTYNDTGNLIEAANSAGKKVRLDYNEKKQISRIENADHCVLEFTYNDNGKPEMIAIQGIGSISVRYDAAGEIESVDSTGGHEAALKVTRAFQELLNLVKPAGVNLEM